MRLKGMTEAAFRQHMAGKKPRAVKRKPNAEKSENLYRFAVDEFCNSAGILKPVFEYRFHLPRRWAFDFAWPYPFLANKVALEIEGGAWTRGRHTRGQGFIDDLVKYSTAAMLGWIVLRATPQMLEAGDCWPWLESTIGKVGG